MCDDESDISIAREQDLFRFIYGIQEEVHRYSVKRMTDAKRKTLKTSVLTNIKGIGPAKAKKLYERFDSLGDIQRASKDDFISRGFSERDADAICEFFASYKK